MATTLMIILLLCIGFERMTGEQHTLRAQCPGVALCNEQSRDTFKLLGTSKLDCGKYARYLACLDSKLHGCKIHSHQPDVTIVNQTSSPAPGSSTVTPNTGTEVPSHNGTEVSSNNGTGLHVQNTTYEIDPLADLKEARSTVCANNAGVVNIPANVSKLLAEHYDMSEDKYASFPDYNYVHKNLSMRAGCEDLSNCSLILEPHSQTDSSYFPCPALLQFQECFDYNKGGCQGDDLAALTSSVQTIGSECPVDSAVGVEASMLLLMTSLVLTTWN